MPVSPTSSRGSTSSGGGTTLYDYTVTGSAKASIDTNVDGTAGLFSGLYNLLVILLYARTDEAVVSSGVTAIFNNDTGANYDRQTLTANNATVTAGSVVAQTSLSTSVTGASSGASMFATVRIDMFNYAGAIGNKHAVLLAGTPQTVAANQQFLPQSWNYRNTSAVTRFKVSPATGGALFIVGSRLTVIGF